jgi:hypothetical protein
LLNFQLFQKLKQKKNSISESYPTTTSSIKETQEKSDQKTHTPSEHQTEHTTNIEHTLTSSYGDNKEKIETTIVKQNPILTTSFNNQKTSIIGTKIPTYNNIPTTIIENKIQTIIITDNGLADVILSGFSLFSKYDTYCTFYIHFVSVGSSISSPTVTIKVEFIYDRSLRFLENHEAICKKDGDNLEKVAYLCKIEADVSNVGSIKIGKEFNFESQEINIMAISPVAQSFMENIKEATGPFVESIIYILDHSIVKTNDKNKTFNIIGIINEPKPTFDKINLTLTIKVEKDKNKTQVESNCTIIDIIGSNYTLNCQGQKNILYNLQSAVSFIDKDLLVINFEQNTTSEIIFSSDSISNINYKMKDFKSPSTGAIVAIVLVPTIVLASLIVLFIFIKKNKSQIY